VRRQPANPLLDDVIVEELPGVGLDDGSISFGEQSVEERPDHLVGVCRRRHRHRHRDQRDTQRCGARNVGELHLRL